MKKSLTIAIILGLAHGVADMATAYLLTSIPDVISTPKIGFLIIVYNLFGFGSQPITGMVTDTIKKPRLAVIMGLLFLAISLWGIKLDLFSFLIAVILAGIGSSLFHVGGGAHIMAANPPKPTESGIFTAPGVMGLAIGAGLGLTGYDVSNIIIFLLLICLALITQIKSPKFVELNIENKANTLDNSFININSYPKSEQSYLNPDDSQEIISDNDELILMMLSIIMLISTIWTSFQFIYQSNLYFIIFMGISAAIGKIIGGIIAEKWNSRSWLIMALILTILLLKLSSENTWFLFPAVALLQSTVPLTLIATAKLMPRQPATASGFALGLGILLAGIPILAGFTVWILQYSAILLIFSLLLVFFSIKNSNK